MRASCWISWFLAAALVGCQATPAPSTPGVSAGVYTGTVNFRQTGTIHQGLEGTTLEPDVTRMTWTRIFDAEGLPDMSVGDTRTDQIADFTNTIEILAVNAGIGFVVVSSKMSFTVNEVLVAGIITITYTSMPPNAVRVYGGGLMVSQIVDGIYVENDISIDGMIYK